jgi:hypothetical protein
MKGFEQLLLVFVRNANSRIPHDAHRAIPFRATAKCMLDPGSEYFTPLLKRLVKMCRSSRSSPSLRGDGVHGQFDHASTVCRGKNFIHDAAAKTTQFEGGG